MLCIHLIELNVSLAVIKSICKLSYCSVSVSKLWRIKLDSQIWAVGSVTRNWCKYVAQMFPKVAQINVVFTYSDPFQNSPKSHHYFWITLESPFVAKNSEKSSNLSHWLWLYRLAASKANLKHWRQQRAVQKIETRTDEEESVSA